jgi:hypothetical protein
MDVFYYNGEGDFNDSESSLYFSNHKLTKEQQYNFRNKHLIHYPKLFDYLNSCIELSKSMLICSYQSATTFKGKSCKSVIEKFDKDAQSSDFPVDDFLGRVPLNEWKMNFFQLHILNFKAYTYKVSELKDIDFIKMDRSILKWKEQQNINDRQWVRCDVSD